MTTKIDRRRFLLSMLPASLLQSWPGAQMEPEDRAEFVFGVTQVQGGRIDSLEARVDYHDEIFRWAASHFGFKNPIQQGDRGEI